MERGRLGRVPSSTSSSAFPSGDEDSDAGGVATPPIAIRRGRKGAKLNDVVSANCSPVIRPAASPAISGITKLRMQLEPLSLSGGGGSNGVEAKTSSRASSMSRGGSQQGYTHGSWASFLPGSGAQTPNGVISSAATSRPQSRGPPAPGAGSSDDDTASEAGGQPKTYEINIENDFVSESVRDRSYGLGMAGPGMPMYGAIEGGLVPQRKMTADDFEPLRCLGKGTYGTVLLVKHRATGRLYAQKQFKKASLVVHKKLVQQTRTERQILELVNRHPFVVKLYYAFQDHEKLYLILEYGQGGELFTHLSTERMFPERVAAFYMAEMVLALTHLHNTLGVVYRDLKPENCLLDVEGHLLLTDFGLSKVACDESDACKSMLGTVEYMAPEVVLGQAYGKAVDWWSFGALGYDLMTGTPPFRGGNNAKIQENIVKQKLHLPYFLSMDAKDLLTRLLRKNPAHRLGSNMPKDLDIIKGHRFFRNIDWKKLAARELEPPITPMITDPELAENFAPEFTNLSLSPVVSRRDDLGLGGDDDAPASAKSDKDDVFGGFSFVASTSLIENSNFMFTAKT